MPPKSLLPLHEKSLRQQQSAPHNQAGRLTRLSFLSNRVRNEGLAFLAELCGTFMFLFFAFAATQVANTAASADGASASDTSDGSLTQAPNATTLQYISLAFGFSLTINVWIFFRISGGLFNPAVTLALYLIGAIKWPRAIFCFFAQIIGGICAAAVCSAILPGQLSVSTALGGGTSVARGLFLEMFLTTELVLAVLFLAAEKHKATYLAPIGIGMALFIAELTGVYFTGGSLNPARSFGPAVVIGQFDSYHYIYWIGPLLGSLLATLFYKIMKYAEYETINPGQDFNDQEADHFDPPENASSAAEVARPNSTAIAASQAAEQAIQQAIPEIVRSVSPEKTRVSRYSNSSTLALGQNSFEGEKSPERLSGPGSLEQQASLERPISSDRPGSPPNFDRPSSPLGRGRPFTVGGTA